MISIEFSINLFKKNLHTRYSYSRQNLLSSSKSNEMEHSQAHITHNNLPLTIGNKFRNHINQNTPPDVLNVNQQQRYYHDVFDNFSTNTNYNNLKIGGSVGTGTGPATATSAVAAAVISSTSSSSSAASSMPLPAGVASIFGASISGSSVQGTTAVNSSPTVNGNSESNILNSIANNNNSNTNHENR